MIYLDNGATSFPKPIEMINKMSQCMAEYCGNPGRSGHTMAMKTGEEVYETRKNLGKLFNIKDSSRIVFTANTTEALNLGIKGILKKGDHVITTSMEHNSVLRPLYELQKSGVKLSFINNNTDGSFPMKALKKAKRENTKLIICTHASNVTGTIMPIEKIGEFARKNNILFMVDCAQSAGVLDIDVNRMNIDLLAIAGHKGLLGPLGTGALYAGEGLTLRPLKEGGTGTASKDLNQPWEFPEGYESGTVNAPGIIGLGQSLKFLSKMGIANIRKHEEGLIRHLEKGILNINEENDHRKITLYGPRDSSEKTGIVLFNIEGLSSETITERLSREYDIASRAGFHCAGLAHRTIGTYETGAVRLSVGPFTQLREINHALRAIQIIGKAK